MIVAALGPEGTFSHELAKRLFSGPILLLPSIRSICNRVEEGGVLGLVPIENSEAGGVGPTLDALQRQRIYIVGEAYLPVHHHLAAFEPLERLEVIYAHPQTHEQCSNLLDAWERPIIHTSSNAESAVAMRNRPHSGAVVSQMVADLHGVPIILREIQNSPHNITRFVLLRNTPLPAGEGTKCSIIIDPRTDRPGLLHSLLDAFARHGINLTRIESRPSKRGIGSYIFFLDFETSEGWIDAIAELSRLTCVKELGCYGRLE
ncbi:MAG: prephenate dehydratase domain-containing protein [Methanomicrobiales archaeon]|nr:prephenate dehydratase domain-containing protein [Methanomicrobiales archaeon]MDI6875801.1 prephenate dehydratase domain-containing protein [Methanomicrobiales archaeon]